MDKKRLTLRKQIVQIGPMTFSQQRFQAGTFDPDTNHIALCMGRKFKPGIYGLGIDIHTLVIDHFIAFDIGLLRDIQVIEHYLNTVERVACCLLYYLQRNVKPVELKISMKLAADGKGGQSAFSNGCRYFNIRKTLLESQSLLE